MRQAKALEESLAQQAKAAADRLLTVQELADRLGVSVRQIWKLASSGRIPAPVRLGRSVRWRASDIDRFIGCDCDMSAFEAAQREAEGVPK